jgi:predicted nucleotidyltransferase
MNVEGEIRRVLSEVGIAPSRVVLFGSRVRGDHDDDSDVDILIVSSDFVDVQFPLRSQQIYLEWDYDDFPAPEFVCLTPSEYRNMKNSESPNVVKRIEEEGVRID